MRRVDGEESAVKSPIGYLPSNDSIDMSGLKESVDMGELFHLPKDFWQTEVVQIRDYFNEQIPKDLPETIADQLSQLEQRINKMH